VEETAATPVSMADVIDFRLFCDPATIPTIVMVDLQQEYIAAPRRMTVPNATDALTQCQTLLAYSRAVGFPIAFTKRIKREPFFNAATPFSKWIEGFSPLTTEMVFERELPSCYANDEFSRVMNEGAGGNIVLAGFAGELACLSTVIDAYHRGHCVTFLSDATASHALAGFAAPDVHKFLSKILGLYAIVTTTAEWITATKKWSFLRGIEHGSQSQSTTQYERK
jgi:nicotinamidase-related amidase